MRVSRNPTRFSAPQGRCSSCGAKWHPMEPRVGAAIEVSEGTGEIGPEAMRLVVAGLEGEPGGGSLRSAGAAPPIRRQRRLARPRGGRDDGQTRPRRLVEAPNQPFAVNDRAGALRHLEFGDEEIGGHPHSGAG